MAPPGAIRTAPLMSIYYLFLDLFSISIDYCPLAGTLGTSSETINPVEPFHACSIQETG
jgi:hypothetical protein